MFNPLKYVVMLIDFVEAVIGFTQIFIWLLIGFIVWYLTNRGDFNNLKAMGIKIKNVITNPLNKKPDPNEFKE